MILPASKKITIPAWENHRPVFLYKNIEITWEVFLAHIFDLSKELTESKIDKYIIYCEDSFLFAVGFFALLQANKTIILPPNIQNKILAEFSSEKLHMLTDVKLDSGDIPLIELEYKDNISPSEKLNDNNIFLSSSEIIFYTSGSTGNPKKIYKMISHLMEEVLELNKLFGKQGKGSLCISTVSHQHIYGMLFRLLLPLYRGDTTESSLVFTPEALIDLSSKCSDVTLISSPAFLKRITKDTSAYSFPKNIYNIFSSGGKLDNEVAIKINNLFEKFPTEILGSTETGGIAYKRQSDEWTVFPRVEIKTNHSNKLFVKSPYIYEGDYIETGDTAELMDDTHFLLKERADRIVKIEEKRVSLFEIEKHLIAHDTVDSCRTLILDNHRQEIGCVIVLTESGLCKLDNMGKKNFNISLREYLLQYFEAVVVPRKWRYVGAITTNLQGKIIDSEIRGLF